MNSGCFNEHWECQAASANAPQSCRRLGKKNSGASRNRRRGAVLIVVLVCFFVVAAMFALLASQSISERRAAETRQWTLQAQWIAEAALERAAARLTADANYTGETWTISATELMGKSGALARIRVEAVGDRPNRHLVRVEADYPDAPVHRARWTTQIIVDRPAPGASEGVEESGNN